MKKRLQLFISLVLVVTMMSALGLSTIAQDYSNSEAPQTLSPGSQDKQNGSGNSQGNGNSGSIKTTNSTGTVVNENHYETKQDVYVTGEGFPNPSNGLYYFIVKQTAHNTVLARSSLYSINGSFAPIKLWDYVWNVNSSQTRGFDDSINGVY